MLPGAKTLTVVPLPSVRGDSLSPKSATRGCRESNAIAPGLFKPVSVLVGVVLPGEDAHCGVITNVDVATGVDRQRCGEEGSVRVDVGVVAFGAKTLTVFVPLLAT